MSVPKRPTGCGDGLILTDSAPIASIGLVRQRRGALQLAAWLLALELLGAVGLLVGGDSILLGTFSLRAVVGLACVLVFWTLPNALLFYRRRGQFTGAKKPGL